MSNINAVEFKELMGQSNTDDGSHGLFRFMTEQGEFTVAIPDGQLAPLMAGISNVVTLNARAKTKDAKQKHAFPCGVWNFEADQSGDNLMMTFKVPGGMEMSFHVSKKQIPLMKQALDAAETGEPLIPLAGQIG